MPVILQRRWSKACNAPFGRSQWIIIMSWELTDWPIDRLTDRLIDWLTDWLPQVSAVPTYQGTLPLTDDRYINLLDARILHRCIILSRCIDVAIAVIYTCLASDQKNDPLLAKWIYDKTFLRILKINTASTTHHKPVISISNYSCSSAHSKTELRFNLIEIQEICIEFTDQSWRRHKRC